MTVMHGQRRRAARRRWAALARWALAAVVVATVVRTVGLGWDEIAGAASRLAQVDPLAMAGVLALEVAWAVTLAATQRSAVLATGGQVTRRAALRISMAGFTLSRVVPGGGAAGGLYAMRELTRLGQPAPVAVVAMIASWATSVTSLALLVLGGLGVNAALGGTLGAPMASATAVLAGLAAVGGIVLGALHHAPLRRRVVGVVAGAARRLPLPGDVAGLQRALTDLADSEGRARYLRHSFCWAAVAWLADAAALWLVFLACGHRLSLTALLVGYASANLLNSMPEVTPGWLGVFEAALAATYIGLGVPAGTAVAGVLVYRLASFWLPTVAGVVPAVRSLARGRHATAPAAQPVAASAAHAARPASAGAAAAPGRHAPALAGRTAVPVATHDARVEVEEVAA